MTDAAALSSSAELRMRILSGGVLIACVVLAVLGPPPVFSVLVAIGVAFGLREWHRLVSGGKSASEALISTAAILVAILAMHAQFILLWSLVALLAGAAAVALFAMMRRFWVIWHAFGVFYLGIPALTLILLRGDGMPVMLGGEGSYGSMVLGGLFAAVWAADTGALFVGKLIGGPKLAPSLSPNKTWAGFIGGVLLAVLAEILYLVFLAAFFGTAASADVLLRGGVFGVFLGIAATFGDLFESWVKRVFHTKNSGSLIPGHGGVLDRVDSLLFAAPAALLFFFFGGSEPIFGVTP